MRSWMCGLALSAVLVFGLAHQASAAGFVFHQQNSRANGLGMAYAAVADDPSAVFFNPAGLGFLRGIQITTGVSYINGREKYRSNRTFNDAEARTQYIGIPHFYASGAITDQITLGGGVGAPYGLELDWPDLAETRYSNQFAYLRNQFLSAAVAYRPVDWLSISAVGHFVTTRRFLPGLPRNGLRLHKAVDTSEAIFRNLRANPAFARASNGALRRQARSISDSIPEPQARLKGNGDGFGYTLGVLVKPIKELSLGLTYRSEVNIRGGGTLRFTGVQDPQGLPAGAFTNTLVHSRVRTSLLLPPSLSLAVASHLMDKILLTASADWTGWSTIKDIRIRIRSNRPRPVDVIHLRWSDAWALRFGVEYLLIGQYSEIERNSLKGSLDADEAADLEESTEGGWALALRAGYIWDESPVPNSTLSAFLPDNDRHAFTLGVGLDLGWMRFDLAFQYFDFKTVRKTNPTEGVDNAFHPNTGKFLADAFIYTYGFTFRF